jgi:hypothetical protein
MQRACKTTLVVAILLAVGATGMRGRGQTLEELEQGGASSTFVDGIDAYIYGYPLLMFGVTGRTATTVRDAVTKLGAAPLNQFGKETSLPTSAFKDVVLPSTTTLYTSSFLDLSKEPIILHLPSFGGRFFLMQMLDGWTDVSMQSPGSRLGSKEGNYALIGPDWKGEKSDLPAGLQDTIVMPTNSMWIIGRIYTNGTKPDIDEITTSLYPTLTLTPLSEISNAAYQPPSNLPLQPMVDTLTTPLHQVAGMDACAFFENLAAMMMFNPSIAGQDDNILPKLKGVGLVAGQPFDCTVLQQNRAKLATLQLAVAAARTLLGAAPTPRQTRTGWTVSLDVGTYGNNYLLRAEVAQQALGANNPIDAVYGITSNDGTGAALSGDTNYRIHFAATGPEGIPPVNGFWSLTIYNIDGTLVANTVVNYNAIGVPYVQGHMAKFNADNSLDLYLQSTQPAAGTAFQNWLPTPAGKGYIAFLRMYWPDQSILEKKWIPPPIVKAN